MALKLKGYVGVDEQVALEQGVTFDYPVVDPAYEAELGKIVIRSRYLNGDVNKAFALAYKKYREWADNPTRTMAFANKIDKESSDRFAGLLYDHGVIAWETDVTTEDGSKVAPTRENFVDLLTSQACPGVLMVYLKDASDARNFRAVTAEEAAKNSEASSGGNSGGGATEPQTIAAVS
jgi:hypothetical protein